MEKEQLEYFRGRLEKEREVVHAKLRQHSARPVEDDVAETPDRVEAAEEFAEHATTDALAESEETLLEKIDFALERIKDGSYGRCHSCAEAIPSKRLEAKPSVSLCVKCQTDKESVARA